MNKESNCDQEIISPEVMNRIRNAKYFLDKSSLPYRLRIRSLSDNRRVMRAMVSYDFDEQEGLVLFDGETVEIPEETPLRFSGSETEVLERVVNHAVYIIDELEK